MATDAASIERPTLRMQRVFKGRRALLWAAWTRPEMLARWFGPAYCTAISASSDLKVGGHWSAILRWLESGKQLRPHGVYLDIVPEEHLAFTFKWEGEHDDGAPVDTQVSIAFSDGAEGCTRIDFTHSDLKSSQSLAGHREGWTSTFDRLDAWLAGEARPGLSDQHIATKGEA